MTLSAGSDRVRQTAGQCPLCGAANACAVVAGTDGCWCMSVAIDAEVERWLAAQAMSDRCVCRQCAAGAVPSPCISICELDSCGERCLGCRRTLDEIGGWASFSVAQKAAAWRRIHDASSDGSQ